MFVVAATDCLADQPFDEVIDRLAHLQFTNLELGIREGGRHLKPSEVLADPTQAQAFCRETNRLTISSFFVELGSRGQQAVDEFQAICKLAKAIKVATISVPSSPQGTPFNEEIESLRKMVALAAVEGVRVSVKTEVGRISQEPETVDLLVKQVKGLGICLDPSHYAYGDGAGKNYEPLLAHVHNVHLRDTTKDELQVRIGQGEIDYGKLFNQLRGVKYDRALCVSVVPQDGVDHEAELRKLRLLLESLLL